MDRHLRPSMLDSARRATRAQVARRVQRMSASSGGRVAIGVLEAVEQPPEFPETRALVNVGGGPVWVVADPAAYVVGGSVYVEVDGQGRPLRVTGPTGVPVPDSTVPTTVAEGATPVVIQPAAMLDQGARDAANDAITQLGRAFETSLDAPTPADGVDRPTNAVWTRVNAEGEQVARWRWTGQEWVSEPLAVEIIPAAYIDHLLTNELFTKNLVLSDEVDGWVSYNSGRGIEIFGPDDMPLSRYGAFEENALNFYRNGDPVASISDGGVVYGQQGAFDALTVDGTDVGSLFDDRPRGVIYNRRFPVPRFMSDIGGHSCAIFDVQQGRLYEVKCRVGLRNIDSAGAWIQFFHNSVDLGGSPAEPVMSASTEVPNTNRSHLGETRTGPHYTYREFSFTYAAPGTVDKTVAMLVAAAPASTTGAGRLEFSHSWWTVTDIGRTAPANGGDYSTQGGGDAGGEPAPTPEPGKQQYTKRYSSNDPGAGGWRTFQNVTGNNTGSHTTAVSGPTQGYTPYYPSAGRYASHYYFNSSQIQADIGNGTVISARVRLTCTHSHSNSGGTARLHLHGHGPSGNWGSPDHVADSHFSRGQSKWLGVTSQGWRTGAVRGIGLWSRGSTSTSYYTRFGTTAVLEIVYEK